MYKSTIIENVSADEILGRFQSLENQFADLKKNFEPKSPDEYLTRSEVAKMLKCDLSSIHNWTVKGKLKKYCICNRVYYKRSEVESAIIPI
jgi:hypothetical protein